MIVALLQKNATGNYFFEYNQTVSSLSFPLSSSDPSYDAIRRTGWSNNMHSGKGEDTRIIKGPNAFFWPDITGKYAWLWAAERGRDSSPDMGTFIICVFCAG